MSTALISSSLPAVFVGDNHTSLFANAKEAFNTFGQEILYTQTKAKLAELLVTQKIRLVIVDVPIDTEIARQIIEEIRANRPWLALLILESYPHKGRSIHEVLAYNYYCLARGIDGTITVKQFEEAIKKINKKNIIRFWQNVSIVVCAIVILAIAFLSASRSASLLGAVSLIILGIEFGFYALSSRLRRKSNELQRSV
jgi:hypothetical protein